MNNNPKFRVWSRPDNKFLPINSDEWELSFHGDVWLVKKLCLTFEGQLRNTHVIDGVKFTMQQFTGLQSAQKVDIFVGDIVKFQVYNYHSEEREEYSGQVTFDKGIFLFGKQEFATNDSNFMTHTLEVIGNIFENPELIKQ